MVVILDESGSVGFNNFQIMKAFTTEFLKKWSIENLATRISFITFANDGVSNKIFQF